MVDDCTAYRGKQRGSTRVVIGVGWEEDEEGDEREIGCTGIGVVEQLDGLQTRSYFRRLDS